MVQVTTGGQVPIPKSIREQLGMQPGTFVDLEIDGDTLRVVPARKDAEDIHEILSRMLGSAKGRFTTDEETRSWR
jgi:AbrB family looped-hinge helix DNA binding protein